MKKTVEGLNEIHFESYCALKKSGQLEMGVV